MLCVGTVLAYYEEIEPIDSQDGTASMNIPPIYIAIYQNCTSWLRVLITNKLFEWEWIATAGTIQCQNSGNASVDFQSYITIQTYNLSLIWEPTGTSPTATVDGGVDCSFINIYVNGTSSWVLTMTTNYIPSSYFGSITQIALSAIEGPSVYTYDIGLQI
jgi:hypothetical protein